MVDVNIVKRTYNNGLTTLSELSNCGFFLIHTMFPDD